MLKTADTSKYAMLVGTVRIIGELRSLSEVDS